jgi:hypothetical protein
MSVRGWRGVAVVMLGLACARPGGQAGRAAEGPAGLTREQVIAQTMQPYHGPRVKGVDTSTLTGKVMCGYQGWYTCPGDGSDRGWFHWGLRGFEPGNCSVDLWPDVTELDQDEEFPTPFHHADGSAAYVFSSYSRKTVLRHFAWMRDYGIDGVFVQRFAVQTSGPVPLNHVNTVLASCREGANRYGRAYAVMYDLTGLGEGQVERVIDDWKLLVDKMKLTRDEADGAYLHHHGKPVVAVWGIGFNDNRKYTLEECAKLVEFLKHDEHYGGCTVMVGVPTGWRTLDLDAVNDAALHRIVLEADIISPWTVGRYRSRAEAREHARKRLKADVNWCRTRGKDYLPVVFPGFSWHNMIPGSKLNDIPRLGGRFLWVQYTADVESGATMIYQAMFDELDEGTAILKCTNDPPVGESVFLTYEGLPSDHYLWLVGQAGRLLRGEIPGTAEMPARQAR